MNTCPRCERELSWDEFYRNPRYRTGYVTHCKDCIRERVKAHRQRNIERIREYDRARGYRVYDPKKAKARQATRSIRHLAQPCEVCGDAKVDAHHDDYDRPLDVRWLCRTHHMELHRA